MMTASADASNDRQKKQPLSNGKLPDSEQRFRALIEHSTDAISLLDSEGRILYSSPSYYRILGHTPESRYGHDTFELIHPDDRPHILDMFTRILKNPEPVIVPHTRVKHSDGSWHWIEGFANNMLNVPAVGAIVGRGST